MLIDRPFGDYILLKRLAIGGQSEVFLAIKVGPKDFVRPVAIKILPAKFREDEKYLKLFFKEAFVSSRFAHHNVITIHDARLVDGEFCLIMDFVAGQTVSDLAQRGFKNGQPLSLMHAVQIIADACDGLHYAHRFRDLDDSSYSIVHCDISPQNLMVTYQGVTKVFDFGIAHIPGYEDANDPIAVGGKYAYMSPEQLSGAPVDARSDIFSLGIILFELCTGYRLFRRNSQPEVIKAVMEDDIPAPRSLRADIPPMLEQIIMRALDRDLSKRYASAAMMRDELHQLLAMFARAGDRDALGEYVAALFDAERGEIAQVLSAAFSQPRLPQPTDASGALGAPDAPSAPEASVVSDAFEPNDEATLELDGEQVREDLRRMADASPKLRERTPVTVQGSSQTSPSAEARALRQSAQETARLEGELARVRRRQRVLIATIVLLFGALLLSLGASARGLDRATPGAAQAAPPPPSPVAEAPAR